LVTEHLSWPDIERVKDVNAQVMLSDDFVGFLTHLTKQLGFDHFSYALGYIDGRRNGNVYHTHSQQFLP
jgi:hypothetical protein